MEPSRSAAARTLERPFEVTLLGWLVIALGVCAWIDGLAGCIRLEPHIHPLYLLPWAGRGLLRLEVGWRRFVLVLCWIAVAMVGLAMLFGMLGTLWSMNVGVTLASDWHLAFGGTLALAFPLAAIHVLCRPEAIDAFRLPAGSGEREARAAYVALSIGLTLVLGASYGLGARRAELAPLRARIAALYPEQLRYLRENRGLTPSGAAGQLFEQPEVLGAGWQTSSRTRHWIKLQPFGDHSESQSGDIGWGTARLDSGETVDYVTYRGIAPVDDGILLVIDRRFLETPGR